MDLDAIIVFVYLIATLAYGIYVGRNIKTMKDYALGGKNFTTPVLASTIIATQASSSGFFTDLTKSYADGPFKLIANSGLILGFLFLAYSVAPRMQEFSNRISVSDIMGSVYGRVPRILSAIPVFLKSAGFIAVQVNVLSQTLQYFTDIDSNVANILTTAVVTLYSALGGIRSVTFTDVLQFATFGVIIPLVFVLLWHSVNIVENTENYEKLISHISYFNPGKYEAYSILFLYLLMPSLSAQSVQRMLMAKDEKQMRDSLIICAKFLFVIVLFSNLIGYLLHVENSGLKQAEVLPYLIDKFTYPGMKGLFVVGILAMAMSTADSNLNAGSVCFAHDFCSQIKYFKNLNEVWVSKIFTLLIGFGAFFLATHFKDVISLILFVGGFYTSIVTVPLLLALFGFRSSTRAVLVGMLFGVLTVSFWDPLMKYLEVKDPLTDFVPSMLAHMIGLFGTHYLLGEKGGWGQGPGTGPFNSPPKAETKYVLSKENKSILRKEGFFEILRNNLPQSIFLYNNLAIYSVSVAFVTYLFLEKLNGYDVIIFLGVLLSAFFLILRNIVDDKKSHILLPLYLFATIYCFPFVSVYLLLKSGFAAYAVITAMVSLFVIQILMSSSFAIYVITSGTILGALTFGIIYGQNELISSVKSADLLLVFAMLSVLCIKYLISSSNWKFIKDMLLHNRILRDDNKELDLRLASREDRIRKLLNWKMEVMNNFSHEVRTPLHTTGNYLDLASKSYDEPSKYLSLIQDAKTSFAELQNYILRLADLSEFQKNNMLFEMQKVDLMEILQSMKEEYEGKIDVNLYKSEGADSQIICDKLKMRMIFRELIENSISHAKANFVNIRVRKENGLIKIIYSDMPSRKIENKIEENKLFSPFEVSEKGEKGYKGLGLALVKEVVQSHSGNITGKWEKIDYGFKAPKHAPDQYLAFYIEFASDNQHKPADGEENKQGSSIGSSNFSASSQNSNSAESPLNSKTGAKLKFLLVDDDENILKATSLMLESEGYEVYSVAGGRDAINFIEAGKHDIDVLLLDIMMPDKDGFEVLERVSDILDSKNIKTIFQSGVSNIENYREKLENYRGILFCQKPYKLKDLKSVISKF